MNRVVQQSGHFSWCALIALHLARKDGVVLNKIQENMFLTNWLVTARKQHRFSRETAADIEWLIGQGRALGKNAQLSIQLDYLWQVSSGINPTNTDLMRLTSVIEKAISKQWKYFLLNDKDWSGKNSLPVASSKNGIYLSLSSLNYAFDDQGKLIRNILAKITGDIHWMEKTMAESGWRIKPLQSAVITHSFEIYTI